MIIEYYPFVLADFTQIMSHITRLIFLSHQIVFIYMQHYHIHKPLHKADFTAFGYISVVALLIIDQIYFCFSRNILNNRMPTFVAIYMKCTYSFKTQIQKTGMKKKKSWIAPYVLKNINLLKNFLPEIIKGLNSFTSEFYQAFKEKIIAQ